MIYYIPLHKQGDGIFCPGGSAANMNALSLARYHNYPESKTKGMSAVPPVHIYTSQLVSFHSIVKRITEKSPLVFIVYIYYVEALYLLIFNIKL